MIDDAMAPREYDDAVTHAAPDVRVPLMGRRKYAGGETVTRVRRLVAQPKLLDDRPVAVEVVSAQIVQESAPTAHHPEESPPTVVVLGVALKMLCELSDSCGQ
jgi:hypothetical protein